MCLLAVDNYPDWSTSLNNSLKADRNWKAVQGIGGTPNPPPPEPASQSGPSSRIRSRQEPQDEDEEHSVKSEPLLDRAELYKHVRAKDFQELQLDDSMKMGYVYKSLGAAVVVLRRNTHEIRRGNDRKGVCFGRNIFEIVVTEIVMEGGDADTNVSVAGALLSAWPGYTALPTHWCDG